MFLVRVPGSPHGAVSKEEKPTLDARPGNPSPRPASLGSQVIPFATDYSPCIGIELTRTILYLYSNYVWLHLLILLYSYTTIQLLKF